MASEKQTVRCIMPALIVLAVIAGCSIIGNSEPAWLRNPKSAYPDDQYLVAVGEGDTRRAAESAASANLSRIFETRIQSDERFVDTVQESGSDFMRSSNLKSDINILSSQTLVNIQYAQAWKDDLGRYHAIAYIDRKATAAIYQDRLELLSGHVATMVSDARECTDPIERFALLLTAAGAAEENRQLLKTLSIVHPAAARTVSTPYSENELFRALATAARAIRVRIKVAGDSDGRMGNMLKEWITGFGFAAGEPATLILDGEVSIADTGERTAGLSFYRYLLSVQLSEASGAVLTAFNERGREAVASPDEAITRCFRTLGKAINTNGTRNLNAMFHSMADHSRQ